MHPWKLEVICFSWKGESCESRDGEDVKPASRRICKCALGTGHFLTSADQGIEHLLEQALVQ